MTCRIARLHRGEPAVKTSVVAACSACPPLVFTARPIRSTLAAFHGTNLVTNPEVLAAIEATRPSCGKKLHSATAHDCLPDSI